MKPMALALMIAGILTGCAGAAKEKRPEVHLQDWASDRVVPMRDAYPSSQGMAYPASEQFFLCREKDFCPVPRQEFTERFFLPELPKPIREEPIVNSPQRAGSLGTPFPPAILNRRLSEARVVTLLFHEGEATLTEEASKALDGMFDQIKEVDPLTFRIVVAGYTDGTGSKEKNAKLAEERAAAIADYFKQKGIPDGRIIAGGRPLCCYVAPNDTEEGRAKNRRAEVFVEPVEEGKR